MKIFFVLLICVICGSGCVATKIHTVPVRDYTASYDNVWNGILTYLNKEEEPILVTDKEKGIIATDWTIMEKVFSAKRYKYDIKVTKLDENNVRVAIASPQELYDMGDWDEMLPTERRAQRIFGFIKSHNPAKKTRQMVPISSGISKRTFNKPRH